MIVKCPKCNKLLEVAENKVGKKEICEHCDYIFVIDEKVIYKPQESTTPPAKTPSVEGTTIPKGNLQDESRPKKKFFSATRILIGIIAIVIGIFFILWIVGAIDTGIKQAGGEGIIPRQTYPLVNKSFKLAAGEYWTIEINSVKGAKLVGSVSVPNYDVNVWLIAGARELRAFKNGDEFYYIPLGSAEKIRNFNIDCLLDEGTYYFIVDNTYSVLTPKYPKVDLSLIY